MLVSICSFVFLEIVIDFHTGLRIMKAVLAFLILNLMFPIRPAILADVAANVGKVFRLIDFFPI